MVLHHKVRVFVFRLEEARIRYLLLRKKPREEHVLGPVQGVVGLDEHLTDAVLREVTEETGIEGPTHLIDLEQTSQLVLGDEGLVEWDYGYQAPTNRGKLLVPGPKIAETIWTDFEDAFGQLELPEDRSALVRLQMQLRA